MTDVRKGMPGVQLGKEEFSARVRARFYDPEFEPLAAEIEAIVERAWATYDAYHKSPRRQAAGAAFHDPSYELPVEWLAARSAIGEAEQRRAAATHPRILLINGSSRSEHTCPGEMSKTWRLVEAARGALAEAGCDVEVLDLSRLTSEYGRVIHPCKACVSTAMPLCHWPCSCYPNHAIGQVNDWMAEIYPMWAAAHGVMIITPVHWYQVPSTLKLMMDRLVCADGGNPDPTTTKLKDPKLAKALEMKGWDYPRHLAGRYFAVVAHGDAAGAEAVADHVAHWLTDMELIPAGPHAVLARYLGYYRPYATSHDELDADEDLVAETVKTAQALAGTIALARSGRYALPEPNPAGVRPK